MRLTQYCCVPKRLSLVLTILMVTATGAFGQNWTDYNQWVPSTTFPDMGTNWTGLNDPINSWISSPTSSLTSSWITDPGFLQSLRLDHASMMTPTMSSASRYSMTSLFSPLPSVDPMGNRSTLLQSVRASSWLDSGLPSLQAGQLAVSAFDAMTQAGRHLTYPMFEQVAMARVRPQLVQNQMWQELNLANQGRLKVGQPRLSFEEYYGASPTRSFPSGMSTALSHYAGFEDVTTPVLQAGDFVANLGYLTRGFMRPPDVGLELDVFSASGAFGKDMAAALRGQFDIRHSELLLTGSGIIIDDLSMPGVGDISKGAASYLLRGSGGLPTYREASDVLDGVAKIAVGFAGGPVFGPVLAKAVKPLTAVGKYATYGAFERAAMARIQPQLVEQTKQQDLNFRRNNQLRVDQGMQPLSREEFFSSTPGQTRGFLNTLEMARIQPQLAEQQTWREYNRFNKRFLELGFKQRISFDDFLNMKSLPPIETEYYRQKRWVINDPTRGMTTIYTHSISRFRISIRGGVCVLSGGF